MSLISIYRRRSLLIRANLLLCVGKGKLLRFLSIQMIPIPSIETALYKVLHAGVVPFSTTLLVLVELVDGKLKTCDDKEQKESFTKTTF